MPCEQAQASLLEDESHMEQRPAVPAEIPLGPTSSLATREAREAFLDLSSPDQPKPLADCRGQSGPEGGATLPTPESREITLFCLYDLRLVYYGYRVEFKSRIIDCVNEPLDLKQGLSPPAHSGQHTVRPVAAAVLRGRGDCHTLHNPSMPPTRPRERHKERGL